MCVCIYICIHIELYALYCSPNIARVIKSRKMRWAGHVARRARGVACTGVWWGNLRGKNHLGDPGVDGRIILRWIFRKRDEGTWTGSSWLMIGTGRRALVNAVMNLRVP